MMVMQSPDMIMRVMQADAGKTTTRRKASTDVATRRPHPGATEQGRLEAWFKDFDARMAALTKRQEDLLRSLGIEPKPVDRGAHESV